MKNQTASLDRAAQLAAAADRVLFALPQMITPDAYGAAVALALAVAKEGKRVACVSSAPVPKELAWSPYVHLVKHDVKRIGAVDLAFVVGTSDVRGLGPVWENHVAAFSGAPTVFLSHEAAHKPHDRAVDLVDPSASSSCEIAYRLIEAKWPEALKDPDVAGHLLAGIVAETRSFQRGKVTAEAFRIAAELHRVAPGQHQKIVTDLYKTHRGPQLALWGLVLENLKSYGAGVGSVVDGAAVRALGAEFGDAVPLASDLLSTCPDARFRFIACDEGAVTRLVLESDMPGFHAEEALVGLPFQTLGANRFDVGASAADVARHLQGALSDVRSSPLRRFADRLLKR